MSGSDGEAIGTAAAGETPAVAPPSRRRGLVVAAVLAAATAGMLLKIGIDPLLAAGHGLVRLATEPWQARHPRVVVAEPPRERPYDAIAGLPDDLKAALTRAELQAGVPFRYQLSVPPGEVCALMASHGLPNPGWAPLGAGTAHDCMSDLVPVPGSREVAVPVDPAADPDAGEPVEMLPPRPSSLFFVARGDAGSIDTLRFKLNLEDPAVDAAGRALLLDRLRDLSGPLAWPLPDAVADAIRHHRKLSVFSRGIAVEVHPESGAVRRLNVVLLLRTPASRLPTDRFVQAPALPPDMLPRPEPAARPAVSPPGTPPGAE